MTREEAKHIVDIAFGVAKAVRRFGEERTYHEDEIREAKNMAMEALDQEPCEDAISRDELLKAIDTWDKFGCDADTKLVPYQDHYIPYIHYDDVVKCIKGMPSITPQPKMGHWINEILPLPLSDGSKECVKCSKCGLHYDNPSYYCPNCGAKMVEEVEE